jgi:periplasmic protein TonB
MTRRLFDDLVVSGNAASRPPYLRTVPLSLAVHGMALVALAVVSARVVSEGPVRTSPVVFPSSGERPANAAAGSPRTPVPHPAQRAEARPVVVDPLPPAVVSDVPAVDADVGTLDGPVGDTPICLTGCTPGDAGGVSADGSGSGGTGVGPAPLRPVGGNIREPRRIRGEVPVYPELARRAHIEGKVVLECVIDTDGRVTDLRVVSGPPLLTGAALDGVRTWVYTPTTLNGQPIRVILTVTVKFALARS